MTALPLFLVFQDAIHLFLGNYSVNPWESAPSNYNRSWRVTLVSPPPPPPPFLLPPPLPRPLKPHHLHFSHPALPFFLPSPPISPFLPLLPHHLCSSYPALLSPPLLLPQLPIVILIGLSMLFMSLIMPSSKFTVTQAHIPPLAQLHMHCQPCVAAVADAVVCVVVHVVCIVLQLYLYVLCCAGVGAFK